MSDILASLKLLAKKVYWEKIEPKTTTSDPFRGSSGPDNLLREIEYLSYFLSSYQNATTPILNLVFADPDFANIAKREGELDPFLFWPTGGHRLSPENLIVNLLSSALVQMYVLRLPQDEGTFISTVLKGFEALRDGVKGEKICTYAITGLAGIWLPESTQISTPWGVIRPAGPVRFTRRIKGGNNLETSCILCEIRQIPVNFDRAAKPESPSFNKADTDAIRGQSFYKLALACVLASGESLVPAAPIMTWSINCLPWNANLGTTLPTIPGTGPKEFDLSDRIPEIEEWASIVRDLHLSSLDISARRIVSAVAHRVDPGDSLIDAVIVWENLVGTSHEVTFRVSATLAKLLECDVSRRAELQNKLKKIYGLRSRLVHGDSISRTELQNGAKDAIEIAVKALRISYKKGPDWLSLKSSERSNKILLS